MFWSVDNHGALVLYREVLNREIGFLDKVIRARKRETLPVVLSRREVKQVLKRLKDDRQLMGALMCGSGLRLMECLKLRVKDLDFEYRQVVVRDGKGKKDRLTILPESLSEQYRNSWGTRTFVQPWFTPIYQIRVRRVSRVRLRGFSIKVF